MDLKPIETTYRGYRFRSRLEARWAVFLDACGLKWGYEVEGFDLDGLWYLPDFDIASQAHGTGDDERLPVVDRFWLEVKGVDIEPGDEAWRKAQALADASGDAVVVFCGQITPAMYGYRFTPTDDGVGAPERVQWLACPWCGVIEPARDLGAMSCLCAFFASTRGVTEEAAHRAMQARFERGRR